MRFSKNNLKQIIMRKKSKLIFATLVVGLMLSSCGAKKAEEGAKATDEATTESAEETAAEPAEYTSKDGKFSIKFKTTPQESTKDVPTAVGDVKMYMFMHEESVTKAYMVAYCDYPSELIKASDAKTLLNGSKEGVVGQFQATITEEKSSKFQGHESMDFTAGGPQYNTAYKLVLAGNRLYQIGILQDGSAVSADDIDKFIGSFKITE
jgi:hypothetical protein